MPTRSHRRGFVYNIAAVGLLATANRASAVPRGQIKAVAFDALAVFDVRPVFTLAEEFYPGRAIELANLWRTSIRVRLAAHLVEALFRLLERYRRRAGVCGEHAEA